MDNWAMGDWIVFIFAVIGVYTVIRILFIPRQRGGYQPKTPAGPMPRMQPRVRSKPDTEPPKQPKGQGGTEIAQLKKEVADIKKILESKDNGT